MGTSKAATWRSCIAQPVENEPFAALRKLPIKQPMNIQRRKFLYLAAAGALPGWLCRPASAAQTYPSRSVRIIVAYAPGGQTDTIARLLAQKLSDRFGTQFYVENVPGAGGNTAWLEPHRRRRTAILWRLST